MKVKDIRELSVGELRQRSNALRKERVLLRLQNASSQLENTARIGLVCQDIARIETVLGERRSQVKAK